MTAEASVTALLAKALGRAEAEISEDTGIATCDSWDSLAHFRVVAEIEERIGRPLSPTEIFDATDFKGVAALLTAKVDTGD